jgi:hypothetical protein
MRCENVQELISLLLDRRASAVQRENVVSHVKSCRECGEHFRSMNALRTNLRQIPEPVVPVQLAARLRVVASHERQRQLSRISFSARLRNWAARTELMFDNMMRPVAVPLAGGLLSALILFCALVPNLSFAHNFTDRLFFTYPIGLAVEQVPQAGGDTLTSTTQSFRILPVDGALPADARDVVELTIDASGHVSDYYVTRGELTPEVQSIIMFSSFIPATNLGIPVTGKVRIVQAPSRNVRS